MGIGLLLAAPAVADPQSKPSPLHGDHMALSFGIANYHLTIRTFDTLSITLDLGQELTEHFQIVEELGAASAREGDHISAAIGARWAPFDGAPRPSTLSPHFQTRF